MWDFRPSYKSESWSFLTSCALHGGFLFMVIAAPGGILRKHTAPRMGSAASPTFEFVPVFVDHVRELDLPIARKKKAVVVEKKQVPIKLKSTASFDRGTPGIEGAAREGNLFTAKERYLSQVHSEIESRKVYPSLSKQLSEEGTVVIALALDRAGTLLKAEVKKSSNYVRLDEAALKAVQSIPKFPPFPEELPQESIRVAQAITFELD